MNHLPITKSTDASKSRSPVRSITTVLLTIGVVATIAVTGWKLNQQYNLSSSLMSYAFLVATGLAIVYRIANPIGWNLIVRGMGHNVRVFETTRIWLLAESRRWLPGGIWGYTSRAVASQEIGMTKTAATASMAIELLVTITAAVCVSIVGMMIHYTELYSVASELFQELGLDSNFVLASVFAGVVALTGVWILRNQLKQKITVASQKFDSLRGVNIKTNWLAGAVGYFVLMAVLNGAVNSVLLNAVSTENVPGVAMIAATATAWIIGFFAVFSPGGILVREAALAALLLPWLPYETGFMLAILSRFAQLIAEVVGMAVLIRKRSWTGVVSAKT